MVISGEGEASAGAGTSVLTVMEDMVPLCPFPTWASSGP